MYFLSQTDWWAVSAAWATFAATCVLALLTLRYVRLTSVVARATERAAAEAGQPRVLVRVVHDEQRRSILLIVIENFGRGVAYGVRFQTSRPVPAHAFGIEAPMGDFRSPMKDGPLVDGIPVLAPGDRRVITWGQYGGLKEVLKEGPIEIVATYRDEHTDITTRSLLEIESFAGTDASDTDPTREGFKELTRVLAPIGHWSYPGALRVMIVDPKKEREEAQQRAEAQRAKRQGASATPQS